MANVNVKVGYTVDKTGLNEIKRQLTDIRLEAAQAKLSGNLTKDLEEASRAASQLEDILNSAWNSKLNQLDLSKVNIGIKNTYDTIQNLQKALVKSGSAGATAYNNFAMQVLNTNIQLKQTSQTLDKMATTLKNTIRYGISSSIFNNLTNSIQKAYDYSVKLDTSLNDIRIVTEKSAEEMDKFAVRANKVAKDLGRSTKDFTEASLIYYQQGLDDREAQARAEVTMKAANVTGQTGREVSEQLTSVWNGYKVSAEETELYVDKLAAVAAATAADLEELSTGMSKVASAANLMGVDVDQLNAQLATIVSVTRQAPESVGVALKTIYARMSDIKSGLDDETTLGNYTEKMAQYGINVLDANNNLRDMGDVIEEIGGKWTSMSREQQIALSQTMAGTRQYNNLLSLFDNWGMYTDALETSANAAGTLQKQQDIYMESTAAHLQQLSTEAERTYDILFDQKTVNGFADALTGLLGIFNDLLAGLGGGIRDFTFFGSTVANIFNKQIGSAIERQIENFEKMRANVSREELQRNIIAQGGVAGEGVTNAAAVDKEAIYAEKTLELQRYLTAEQAEQFTNETAEIGLLEQRIQGIEQYRKIAERLGVEISEDAAETQENFEEQIDAQSKLFTIENKRYKSLKKGIEDYVEGTEHAFDSTEAQKEIVDDLILNLGDMKTAKEDEARVASIIEKINNNEKLDEQEIQFILENQKNVRNDIANKVNELKIGAQGVADEESGILVDLQNEQILREKNLQSMQQQVERQARISQIVQGMTSLLSLTTALSGAISTLNNKDLTVGEKIKQLVATLMASLPIIIMNFSTLKMLLPNLLVQFGLMEAAQLKAAIASGTLGTAIWTALAPILPIILGVTAAVGLLVGAIYLAVKASQREQEEINKMREAAAALKEESEQVKSTIDDINNDFDKYKEVLGTLESCTQGTKEWNEALKSVNNSALEILNKYPELAKIPHLFSRINGVLTLNQSVLDDYLDKLSHRADILQSASLMGSAVADERQVEKDKKDLFSDIRWSMGSGDSMYQGTSPYGNVSDINKSLDIVSDNFKSLANLTESEYKAKLVNLGVEGRYIEALMKYQSEIDNLANQTENVSTQMENAARAIAALKIGDGGSSPSTVETQTILAANDYEKKYKKERQELYDKYTGSGISKASGNENPIYKEMLRELQSIEGYENYKAAADGNGVLYTDDNRAFVFNVNGESKEYSAEEIAEIIAADRANKEDKDYTQEAKDIVDAVSNKLGIDEESADLLIKAIKDSDYNGLSQDLITQLKEVYGKDGSGLKNIITNEQAKELGIGTGEDFVDGINTAIKNYDPKKAAQALKEKIKTLYSTVAQATGESEGTVKALVAQMKKLPENAKASEETLINLAKTVLTFNKNLKKLGDSFSNNRSLLMKWKDSVGKMDVDTAKAVGELKENFDNLFDTDVSTDFLKDNLDTIEAMLKGDTAALNELEAALGKEFILSINDGQLQEAFANAESAFNELSNTDLEIGAVFNDEKALADIQTFFNTAKLSQADAQAVLNKYGYEGELEEIKEPSYNRVVYEEQTDVRFVTKTAKPPQMSVPDGDGFKTITGAPMTVPVPVYSTKMVPKEIPSGGNSYWVLKSKDGKGATTGLVGSVKSRGTGKARKNTVSNFSGYKPTSGGGGGGSGKKGGGGGGGSAKEPDTMDPLEKEVDRYHDVDIQLKQISTDLDKIEKQKEKLFGKDLIENLNKQLKILDKQINTTNEKIKIAKQEAQELREKLSGKGISFGADGTIANYAAAYTSQLNYVNGLINQYNNMSASAQEGFKDTVEKAKEDFDKFVDDLNRYDELITGTIPDLEDNIQDAIDKQIDIQIEKFDMEIEIRLNLAEAERNWNEFKKKIIDGIKDDDILGNAMAKLVDFSSYYKEDNTGIVQALRKQVDNTLAELNAMDTKGWSNVYGNNRVAALDDLKKYYEELMSNLTDVLELQENIHQSYMDMLDEAQEKFDEQISSYEMISELIEHDMQVISLVYGEQSYSQLAKYYEKQQENYNSQLDFQRRQVDFWQKAMDAEEKGSDAWENARDKWKDAVKELNSLIEESIENLQNKYYNAIDLIFQNLNNKLTGGLGLDYVEEEWNLINKNAEQYLDTINALYAVQKLEDKYLDALENSDSLAIKRELKELMDAELADLRERDKLTQYDIDRANQKYEIALKQIALQEAQRNKTKMRLRRDSQGNYRYEYTSDADQVSALQDELDDMYNSLYNFDKGKYQDNLNQIYTTWSEFQEKMAEAAKINDPVDRAEKEKLIKEQYEPLINGIVEQNLIIRKNLQDSAFEDLARLYEQDVEDFKAMTEEEKNNLMTELIPNWDGSVQHMADAFAGQEGFLGVCKDAFGELDEAMTIYEEDLEEVEVASGNTFDKISKGLDPNIDKTQTLIQKNQDLITAYNNQINAIKKVENELDTLTNKYKGAETAAVKATEAAYKYWQEQQRQAGKAASTPAQTSTSAPASTPAPAPTTTNKATSSNSGGGDGTPNVGDVVTFVKGKYTADSYGGGGSGSKGLGGKVKISIISSAKGRARPIHITTTSGSALGWVSLDQISGYDTGGYTGNWNNNGRLAFLHQKELVLNQEDTKNMLNAVNIIRNITDMLGSAMLGRLAAATAGSVNTSVGNSLLEQNVHIDAQFPNVTNSREIEEALNNLVNMASMRANKR